jgi:hypothetical protein
VHCIGRPECNSNRPNARPGESPSFDHLRISGAGTVRRPQVCVPEAEIRDLPFLLIRVLDADGRAVGPWDPHLNSDHLRRGLRAMLLTRVFDERMFLAHRQGKTSFYMKSTGEEAIGAAQSLNAVARCEERTVLEPHSPARRIVRSPGAHYALSLAGQCSEPVPSTRGAPDVSSARLPDGTR